MNKKNILKWIIIVICIIIVLFVVLNSFNSKEDNQNQIGEQNTNQNNIIGQNDIAKQDNNEEENTKLTNYSEYFAIDNIVNMYVMNLQYLNGDAYIDESRQNDKQQGISDYKKYGIEYMNIVLDKAYIDECNVNDEALYKIANKYVVSGDYSKMIDTAVLIYDIDVWQLDNEKKVYLVDFAINGKEAKMLIKLNTSTNLYTIFLEDYIEKYTNIDGFNYNQILNTDFNVQDSFNRRFKTNNATDEILAKKYFSILKLYLTNDYKKLYNMLEPEYSKKRFAEYNDYVEYIKNNNSYLNDIKLSKYKVNKENGYTIYNLLDNYNNCYIVSVNTNNILNFSVQLDDYTIKSEEYKKDYDTLSEEEKAQTNIEIFFRMLNIKDYKSAYNVLDATFKKNNFSTIEKFEAYVKEKFFDYTIINEVEDITKSSSYYVCTIKVSSKDGKESTETFVVSLEEDAEFKISYTIK